MDNRLLPSCSLVVVAVLASVGCGSSPAKTLDWQTCAGTVECATLEVPLDWGQPDGEQIVMAIARHRATDAGQRIGSLFFVNGQGASAMDFVASGAASALFPAQLVERFDLVGIDPRGGGVNPQGSALELPFESTSFDCALPAHSPELPYFPENSGEYEALLAHNHQFARSCGPLVGKTGAASHARDVEAVRAALGVEKIHWISWTTGSLIGQTYATLYPDRVAAMVLDQPFDAMVPFADFVRDHAAAVQDEFDRLVDKCAATPTCPYGADLRTAFGELIDAANKNPVIAAGPTPPPEDEGAPIQHPFTGDELLFLTEQLLEIGEVEVAPGFTGFDAIPAGVAEAMAGSTSVFPGAYFYGNGWPGFWNRYRVHACTNFGTPIESYEALRALMVQVREVAPDMRGISQAWDILTGCLGWPPERIEGIPALSFDSSLAPALVLSSRHSAYAPYAHAAQVAKRLPGAALVTYDGDTHIVMLTSRCATEHVVEYLVAGKLPAQGTVCR